MQSYESIVRPIGKMVRQLEELVEDTFGTINGNVEEIHEREQQNLTLKATADRAQKTKMKLDDLLS